MRFPNQKGSACDTDGCSARMFRSNCGRITSTSRSKDVNRSGPPGRPCTSDAIAGRSCRFSPDTRRRPARAARPIAPSASRPPARSARCVACMARCARAGRFLLLGPAAFDLAGIDQLSAALLGEIEAVELRPFERPAGDREGVAHLAGRLGAEIGAAGFVASVLALRDDAFEAHRAGVLPQLGAVDLQVLAEPHRPIRIERSQQLCQHLLALDRRRAPQVEPVEIEQVEKVEHQGARSAADAELALELVEIGLAVDTLTHSCQSTANFAVVHYAPHDVVAYGRRPGKGAPVRRRRTMSRKPAKKHATRTKPERNNASTAARQSNSTLADLQQQVGALTRELAEAREQQTATSDVL